MRVLALTSLYPNPYQPHRAAFNRQQLRALADEHEVRVIAPIAWTGEWSGRRGRAGSGERLPAERRLVTDGMIVHHPRFAYPPKFLRVWHGRFFVQSVRRCFTEVVRDWRPDVVLGCWAYPDGWAAVQLAREAGLPVAIKVHGSDVLTVGDYPAKRRRTVETLTGADAVVAVSKHLRERAIEMGADPLRTRVVYNGVDTGLFMPGNGEEARRRLGITTGAPLILAVGNLVHVKGFDVLLKALSTVADAIPFQCAVVGGGPLERELQREVNDLGLGDRVRLVGARPLSELATWYRASSLLVLPSRSEGIPNVLLEAMACGTPFIASRVGGVPEIAGEGALVAPEDPAALAGKIREVLSGGGVRTAPAACVARSWSDSARALAGVLGDVAGLARQRARMAG